MIKELEELKIELMVSIWPMVDKKSENYKEMLEKGYLTRTERGIRTMMDFQGNTVHFDPTNPGMFHELALTQLLLTSSFRHPS